MFPAWTRPLTAVIAAVSAAIASANTYVKRAGDTMTGGLTINTTGVSLRIQSSSGTLRFGSGSDVALSRPSANALTVTGAFELDSGATGSRPSLAGSQDGSLWFDTTLGKVICWNGSAWVNVDGSAL